MTTKYIEMGPGGEPGKYDHICEMARQMCEAKACLLIIGDGFAGDGFSAAIDEGMVVTIPAILREVADKIEQQIKEYKEKMT